MSIVPVLAAMAFRRAEDTKSVVNVGPKPRFELAAPLPGIPSIMVDGYSTGYGLAQETVRSKNLQARILWIDATANIDRYNTEEKIVALCKQIKASGFNTIVFDVKPIVGFTVYPSAYAPKLKEWKGLVLGDYDPVPAMVREAHANGLTLYASLNAFGEGHRIFHLGPGYAKPAQQSVLYDGKPMLRSSTVSTELSGTIDRGTPEQVIEYSTLDKVPLDEGTLVVLKRDLSVDTNVPTPILDKSAITVPKGAVLLFGAKGTASDFLKINGLKGAKLAFDTDPIFVITSEKQDQIPLMMNPNHAQVQERALDILREAITKYAFDGVVYDDRLRYANISADFSSISQGLFEREVSHAVKWPDDVYHITLNPNLTRGIRPGPLYDQWIAWRADQLRLFALRAKTLVKSVRPDLAFGLYAGSWYGEYPSLGHNYASPKTEAGFWSSTPAYNKSGTAPLLDFLIAGCYYPTATIYDAMSKGQGIGYTIESAGTLVNRMVRDESWSYAGIQLSDYKDDPDGLQDALQAACASTQGVMVFDLSHDIEPMWPVFARAFATPAVAPDRVPGLLEDLRRRRHRLDLFGSKEPPIIIAAGSAGTGQ